MCTSVYRNIVKLLICGYAASDKLSLHIPGVTDKEKETVFVDESKSTTMVPQGMCFVNDYVIFTGYADKYKSPSVIWIKNTADLLLATIELPDKEHVGGVCFDGTYLWIPTKKNVIRYIRFSDIEAQIKKGYRLFSLTTAVDDKKKVCAKISILTGEINTGSNRDISTLTYYNGSLYTAEFNGGSYKNSNPKLRKFSILLGKNQPTGLKQTSTYPLPNYVQGVQLYKKNNTEYLILSCSFGRDAGSISQIEVYKLTNPTKNIKIKNLSKNNEYLMVEGIALRNGYLYAMTESAAEVYKNDTDKSGIKSPNPIDIVNVINLSDLL